MFGELFSIKPSKLNNICRHSSFRPHVWGAFFNCMPFENGLVVMVVVFVPMFGELFSITS